MGGNELPPHLDNMGRLSDTFRAQLEEMKARHAETDRRVQASIARTAALLAKIEEERAAWEAEESE